MAVPAHVKYIGISILFILATINFTKTTIEILENSKRLDNISQEVAELEEEKKDYENSVAYKKTDEYVEEKARNDLNLIRPGEKVYVLPQGLKEVNLESKVLGQRNISLEEKSNPAKWLSLFLTR
jgi:cell division protein FtsB